jgi:hypothetical protein
MKKSLYIVSFAFLGLLVSTLIHGLIEIVALDLIFNNPSRFANTIWWQEWGLIHDVFAFGLWTVGLSAGVYLGIKWWGPYGSKKGLFGWGKQ